MNKKQVLKGIVKGAAKVGGVMLAGGPVAGMAATAAYKLSPRFKSGVDNAASKVSRGVAKAASSAVSGVKKFLNSPAPSRGRGRFNRTTSSTPASRMKANQALKAKRGL